MFKKRTLGWLPDYPDFRDYTEETQDVKAILQTSVKKHAKTTKVDKLPASVDLRP